MQKCTILRPKSGVLVETALKVRSSDLLETKIARYSIELRAICNCVWYEYQQPWHSMEGGMNLRLFCREGLKQSYLDKKERALWKKTIFQKKRGVRHVCNCNRFVEMPSTKVRRTMTVFIRTKPVFKFRVYPEFLEAARLRGYWFPAPWPIVH